VHAKVQREIAEHDETSSDTEPSKRHLVAKNAGCDGGNRGFHDGLGLSLLAAPTNNLTRTGLESVAHWLRQTGI
jgi:hypothetical protein